MRPITPITAVEFLHHFRTCVPPAPWKGPLAVATSGGPDSTCLLFLLKRMLSQADETKINLPSSLLAVNVDHGLQAESANMSQKCTEISSKIGVPATTYAIPWSTPPYPKRPALGEPYEGVARNVRYRALLDVMLAHGVHMTALGHHADDQVETALMRIAWGTTATGAGGMRAYRRVGMGYGNEKQLFTNFGVAGMDRWILRPLRNFSKARILATCEEQELEYVTDKSNFQPNLTFRNAIRHWLATRGPDNNGIDDLSPVRRKQVRKMIDRNRENCWFDLSGDADQLRDNVRKLEDDVVRVEDEVTKHLQVCRRPAPPSTILLHSESLLAITNPLQQRELVRRILRYVSPHPWGSMAAQVNRSSESLDAAIVRLWPNGGSGSDIARAIDGARRYAFDTGSRVIWRPVTIMPNGTFRRRGALSLNEADGWLVHRATPRRYEETELELELTPRLRTALAERVHTLTVLYDHRFEVKLDVRGLASALGGGFDSHTVWLEAESEYFFPRMFARRASGGIIELAIEFEKEKAQEAAQIESLLENLKRRLAGSPLLAPAPEWISRRELPGGKLAPSWADTTDVPTSSIRRVDGYMSARFVRVLDSV